ncbi:phage baseplate protein [Clostridium brassicae]|uniref:DUF6046 domain-containing protein n=1 Tax=Clostridium brassicae TaxID=2999072 RepID=A0ABT4D6H7_9CLOT|nr:DUF6046 domain-containing protein [Clostridium brassicae]MCY6957899.1 DUF6046 domain-containing protein [Clostridium brassicae]
MPNICKLGDVFFTVVEEEKINYSNDVTTRNVEDGTTISDNVANKPVTISIDGIIFNNTGYPWEQITKLRRYCLDKNVLRYYANFGYYSSMVITSFENTHNKDVAEGITFNMTLQQVRIIEKQTISINTSRFTIPDIEALKKQNSDGASTKLKSTSNAGRKAKN